MRSKQSKRKRDTHTNNGIKRRSSTSSTTTAAVVTHTPAPSTHITRATTAIKSAVIASKSHSNLKLTLKLKPSAHVAKSKRSVNKRSKSKSTKKLNKDKTSTKISSNNITDTIVANTDANCADLNNTESIRIGNNNDKKDILNNVNLKAESKLNSENASSKNDNNSSSTPICNKQQSSASNLAADNVEPQDDLSVIREPLNLGVKSVRQILECVHNGTPEIKDLMLNECNIIYECKICLNLFRSLANFLSHKRFYCKKHYCERMVLFDSTTFNCVDNFNDAGENLNCTKASATSTLSSNLVPQLTQPSTQISPSPLSSSSLQSSTISTNILSSSSSAPVNTASITATTSHLPSTKTSKKCIETIIRSKLKGLPLSSTPLQECSELLESSKNIINDDENAETARFHIDRKKRKNDVCFKLIKIKSNPNAVYQKMVLLDQNEHNNNNDTNNNDRNTNDDNDANTSNDTNTNDDKGDQSHENSNNDDDHDHHQTINSNLKVVQNNQDQENLETDLTNDVQQQIDNESGISSLIANEHTDHETMHSEPSSPTEFQNEQNEDQNAIIVDEEKSENHDDLDETPDSGRCTPSVSSEECNESSATCYKCGLTLGSKKTLRVHMQTIHAFKRLVYPCPFCCLTFKQIFNATRHMAQVHRKNRTQIKYLREVVRTRAYPETKAGQQALLDTSSPANHLPLSPPLVPYII